MHLLLSVWCFPGSPVYWASIRDIIPQVGFLGLVSMPIRLLFIFSVYSYFACVSICLVFPRFACVLGQNQRYHTPSRLFRVSFYAVMFVVDMFGAFLLRQAWAMSSGSCPNCMTFRICSICIFRSLYGFIF